MTHAQHVRAVLSEFKALGVPFALAWANAMRTLPRKHPEYREWREALRWARPAYQAAYEGQRYGVAHLDHEHSRLLLRPADAQDEQSPSHDPNGATERESGRSDDVMVCRSCRRYVLAANQCVCGGELRPLGATNNGTSGIPLHLAAGL